MRNWVERVVLLLAISGCGNSGGLKISGTDAGTAAPAEPVFPEKDAQTLPLAMGMDALVRPPDSTGMRLRFNPTTKVSFRGNLNPGEIHPWDVNNPVPMASYSFSLDIIDSGGTPVWMPVVFTRESAPPGTGLSGTWTYRAEVGGTQVAGNDGPAWLEGFLDFNEEGKLAAAKQTTMGIPLKNGGTQTLLFDFGTGISQSGTGDDAITSMNSETVMTKIVRYPDP